MINAELIKALYGTLQAALLFWQNLTSFLENEHGFEVYPYDWCVVNKTINGKQCTISWHVDDLKISHMDQLIVKTIITTLQDCYRQETALVVHCGQVHDYLGMAIDYSIPGKVCFSMDQYITNLLVECPDHLMKGSSTTPTTNHLFDDDCPKLNSKDAILLHHLVAKLLYVCKCTWPDIQLAMSFLTT